MPLPYLTPAEYLASPTGAVDVNNLVDGGNAAAQTAALINVIRRVSAWIDTQCDQSLISANRVEFLRARWHRGELSVHPKQSPLNELVAVAVGTNAGNLTTVSDLTSAWIDQQNWVIPSTVSFAGWPFSLGSSRIDHCLVKLTTASGWPNTTLAAPVIAGATSLTVASSAGFAPAAGSEVGDDPITIIDGEFTETITVTGRTGVVLTCAALVNAHAAGVVVSGLPGDVKEAATLATSAFIRTKQADSLTMQTSPGQPGGFNSDPASMQALGRAMRMLENYHRVR